MNNTWQTTGRDKMGQVVKLITDDLATLSTGRARPALIEELKVEAYEGSWLTLKELATISTPDPQTLSIQVWDQSVTEKIVKSIQNSNLNLNPVVDQAAIRLHVPSLTAERRQELVKAVKQKVESGRAMLRQIRVDLKKDIDAQNHQPGVSEDDIHEAYDQLQELVDGWHARLDELEQKKEQELTSL
ncbi:ribosome recycling factor [Candidatus Beckwithbacteria bacterium CG_4_10_14_0_2_um_filter_47_25]|uniref:Ribosome recycling factor n=2 Tax=Candidatus Beckwithiibacteriota TaxID=1752726 RepID=A0A2H0B3B7_9BACT|nr:MAG: ribosome recycling factor [Candidatus Beckwithbacteria bacterium CG23_combo_of_CG06-09_8_20_14_all_47_9]PJA22474.1 MAG: ribosome recycling factor [Candidatus Beckwithbacteria bacterium CG_4_10_14_0_2_um_filter_47_25]